MATEKGRRRCNNGSDEGGGRREDSECGVVTQSVGLAWRVLQCLCVQRSPTSFTV